MGQGNQYFISNMSLMHDFVTKLSASFAILDFFIQNKVVLGYKYTRMNKCVCFRAAGSVSSYDTKRPNEK